MRNCRKRRGTIGGSNEQICKRVDALKECYGVKVGRPKISGLSTSFQKDTPKSLKKIAEANPASFFNAGFVSDLKAFNESFANGDVPSNLQETCERAGTTERRP